MNWRVFLATFGLIFVAELGDKTQLAALAMTARTKAPWSVFLGGSLALCVVTLFAVLAGGWIARYVPPAVLERVAAVGFIAIGGWMLLKRA